MFFWAVDRYVICRNEIYREASCFPRKTCEEHTVKREWWNVSYLSCDRRNDWRKIQSVPSLCHSPLHSQFHACYSAQIRISTLSGHFQYSYVPLQDKRLPKESLHLCRVYKFRWPSYSGKITRGQSSSYGLLVWSYENINNINRSGQMSTIENWSVDPRCTIPFILPVV